MSRRFVAAFAAAFLLPSAGASAQRRDTPVTERQLMRHIEVLASDAFEGRLPGTEGETRTTAYIVEQLRRRRLEPGGADGGWFQPVPLVERRAGSHRVRWSSNGRELPFEDGRIILAGREPSQRLERAPALFVGHGLVDRERGIDQLAGADLAGAVAFVLVQGPEVAGFPGFDQRATAVAAAGAAAVIGVVADDAPWPALVEASRRPLTELVRDGAPPIVGAIPAAELSRLIAASGGDFVAILNEHAGPAFRAVPLNLHATIDVTTEIRRFTSNNVIGRIRGTAGGRESVLLLGHWDHIGLCRPEGEEDRICNGAVDNASGIALLIEAAGRLAARRPERDVLILATTAEETGLFGAEHFAARPTVPLASIVAAINVDTVAIHGRGEPVAVIGRGIEPLDRAIAETAAAAGRRMDTTYAADAFVERQDGWALARAGVPSVMVGGSFADMAALEAFLSSDYHGPDDEPRPDIPLAGAAEDADLLVALTRRLADPARYRPPPR
jgi:hypothetical protein